MRSAQMELSSPGAKLHPQFRPGESQNSFALGLQLELFPARLLFLYSSLELSTSRFCCDVEQVRLPLCLLCLLPSIPTHHCCDENFLR